MNQDRKCQRCQKLKVWKDFPNSVGSVCDDCWYAEKREWEVLEAQAKTNKRIEDLVDETYERNRWL